MVYVDGSVAGTPVEVGYRRQVVSTSFCVSVSYKDGLSPVSAKKHFDGGTIWWRIVRRGIVRNY